MTFEVHVLASGSDGNCSVLIHEDRALMIDAGLNYKTTLEFMNLSGVDKSMVEGIVITHEHSDHITGAQTIAKRLDIPIYCNRMTFIKSKIKGVEYREIRNMESFELAGMDVMSLPTSHKAVDPCGYYFTIGDKKFLYATDTGKITFPVEHALKDCDLAILESNYDKKMLDEGPYPVYLKKWIDSDIGHLSNVCCGEVLKRTQSDRPRKVFLAHLSKTNNLPDVARETVSKISGIKRSLLDCLETPLVENDTRVVRVS